MGGPVDLHDPGTWHSGWPLGGSGMIEILIGLAAFVAAIAGWFVRGFFGNRQAREDAEHDAMQDAYEREARGREAVKRGRASGDGPDDRVSGNDDRW